MRAVFADTYYFIALLAADGEDHRRALEASERGGSDLVTTTWVLTELGNFFSTPRDRPAFLATVDALQGDWSVTIVPAEQALFDRGIELYASRPDKGWSLTDCISFVVMRQAAITDALTGDHHFEQAGFVALLKA